MVVALVVACVLAFAATNGFHDASDAVATSVSTRTLRPRTALSLAALMNLAGALLGAAAVRLPWTLGYGILTAPRGADGLRVLAAAVLAATAWNVMTWWWALPSSSTHALVGGLAGAGLAAGATLRWPLAATHVLVPLLLSPVVGLLASLALMAGVRVALAHASPGRANRRLRLVQTLSAASVAFGHGLQDAPKSMAVVMAASGAVGTLPPDGRLPAPLAVACALALAVGTASGGWRLMRTVGERIIDLDPARGAVAEGVTALVLGVGALALRVPVSTTHTLMAAVVGAGASYRRSAVRWRVARRIAAVWIATIPVTGALAAALYGVLTLVAR